MGYVPEFARLTLPLDKKKTYELMLVRSMKSLKSLGAGFSPFWLSIVHR